MLKRILVALSGTPFTPVAVRQAVQLASQHGASITAVTVVDVERLSDVGPIPLGGASAAHELTEHRVAVTRDRVKQEVADFERACRQASIPCVVDRESGDAFELLLALWRYHDLTVIGLRGLFEYGVVHNPDDRLIQLIHRGVGPILAVASEYHEVNRVLVAYSGSRESALAMKHFVQLQLWPEAAVKLVCFGIDEAVAMPLLIDATAYLRAHGYEPEAESLPGSPRKGLLAEAQAWGANLAVMGSASHSRIAKLLLGDTTPEVLASAGIPLFLSH